MWDCETSESVKVLCSESPVDCLQMYAYPGKHSLVRDPIVLMQTDDLLNLICFKIKC